jgi:hypothetical protein
MGEEAASDADLKQHFLEMPALEEPEEIFAFGQDLLATLTNSSKGSDNGTAPSELKVNLTDRSGVSQEGEQQEGHCFKPLLEFIKKSTSLSTIILDGSSSSNLTAPVATVSLFLDAITCNPFITKLGLRLCQTSVPLFSTLLLKSTANIKHLELKWCQWKETSGNDDMNHRVITLSPHQQLAAAFRDNTTIETLKVEKIGFRYLFPILISLGQHPKLKRLSLHSEGPTAATTFRTTSTPSIQQVIQQLVTTSTSLKHLDLHFFRFHHSTFEPIAKGLLQSQSVVQLSFTSCNFGSGLRLSLRQLFGGYNIDNEDANENNDTGKISTAQILAKLLRHNKTLTKLDMNGINHNLSPEDFAAILQALEQSNNTTLYSFQCGSIRDSQFCHALIDSLPKMLHLRQIQFELDEKIDALLPQVMEAFRRNSSLYKANVQAVFLQQKQQERMHYYCQRNEAVPLLLLKQQQAGSSTTATSEDKDSGEVPATWWPHVFEKTLECEESGPTTMFHGLMSHCEREMPSCLISKRARRGSYGHISSTSHHKEAVDVSTSKFVVTNPKPRTVVSRQA